jgi:hypothetical protein
MSINHVYFNVEQEPALLSVQGALLELRGVLDDLLAGRIADFVAREMADNVMAPLAAVQIAHENADEEEIGEHEIEETEGAVGGQAINETAWIGHAVLVRQLEPDTFYRFFFTL